MSLTFKNPFNEEKKKVALDKSLSNQEKDEKIQELDLKSSQWIKEKIKLVESEIKSKKDFIVESKPKIVKLEKKDLRKVYKQTVDYSREIKELYNVMRDLNKDVRELLSK